MPLDRLHLLQAVLNIELEGRNTNNSFQLTRVKESPTFATFVRYSLVMYRMILQPLPSATILQPFRSHLP